MLTVLRVKTYALWMKLNNFNDEFDISHGWSSGKLPEFVLNRKPNQWLKLTLLCQNQRKLIHAQHLQIVEELKTKFGENFYVQTTLKSFQQSGLSAHACKEVLCSSVSERPT